MMSDSGQGRPAPSDRLPAYWEGFGAFRRKEPSDGCAYRFGTPERDAWLDGYDAAKREGDPVERGKSPLRSKTTWTGVVLILMTWASFFQGAYEHMPLVVAALSTILGMLIIVFRFLTSEPLVLNLRLPEKRPGRVP